MKHKIKSPSELPREILRYLCVFIKSFIPPSNLSTSLSVPIVIRTNLFILRYFQTFFLAFLNFAVPIMVKK